MNFEKYVNSKVYYYFDKAYYLILINLVFVLISVLGLGIFTFFPALAATYILLQRLSDNKSISIFKGFYTIIKRDYFKLQKLFLVIALILCILSFNTLFFYEYAINQNSSLFYLIGLFLFLSMDLFIMGLLLHIFPIYMYFKGLKTVGIIKFSFLLVFAYPFRTLLLVILTIGWTLLISLQPPIIPFVCITIPVYIYLQVFQGILKKLTENDKNLTRNYDVE